MRGHPDVDGVGNPQTVMTTLPRAWPSLRYWIAALASEGSARRSGRGTAGRRGRPAAPEAVSSQIDSVIPYGRRGPSGERVSLGIKHLRFSNREGYTRVP